MAPHSSTFAWKIPWMEEPGRLQSLGSLRVGYDWATSLSLFTFMHWCTPCPGRTGKEGRNRSVGWKTENSTLELTSQSKDWGGTDVILMDTLSLIYCFLKSKGYVLFFWRIVDLQCCAAFCCTAKWLSYTPICIFFFPRWFIPRLDIVPCAIQ